MEETAYPELTGGLDYYVTAADQWYIAFARRSIEDRMVSALDLASRVVPLERVPTDMYMSTDGVTWTPLITDTVVEEGILWTSSSLDNPASYVNTTATGTTVNILHSLGTQGVPVRGDGGLPLPTEKERKSAEDAAAELLAELTECRANGSDDEKLLATITTAIRKAVGDAVAHDLTKMLHGDRLLVEKAAQELTTEVWDALEKIKEESNVDSEIAPGVWKTAIERAENELLAANVKRMATKPKKFTIPNDAVEEWAPAQDPLPSPPPWKIGDVVAPISPTIWPGISTVPYVTTTKTSSPTWTAPSTSAHPTDTTTVTANPLTTSIGGGGGGGGGLVSDEYERKKQSWVKAELLMTAEKQERSKLALQQARDAKAKHDNALHSRVRKKLVSLVKQKQAV